MQEQAIMEYLTSQPLQKIRTSLKVTTLKHLLAHILKIRQHMRRGHQYIMLVSARLLWQCFKALKTRWAFYEYFFTIRLSWAGDNFELATSNFLHYVKKLPAGALSGKKLWSLEIRYKAPDLLGKDKKILLYQFRVTYMKSL